MFSLLLSDLQQNLQDIYFAKLNQWLYFYPAVRNGWFSRSLTVQCPTVITECYKERGRKVHVEGERLGVRKKGRRREGEGREGERERGELGNAAKDSLSLSSSNGRSRNVGVATCPGHRPIGQYIHCRISMEVHVTKLESQNNRG